MDLTAFDYAHTEGKLDHDLSDWDERPNPFMLARACNSVLGEDCRWDVAALGRAYQEFNNGVDVETAARTIYDSVRSRTLTESKKIVRGFPDTHFLEHAKERNRTGSAENPITKMLPSAVTERRFLERLEGLKDLSLSYRDDRRQRRGLSDFTIVQGDHELSVNVKSSNSKFRKAKELVGIEPENCFPIPAYKAHRALEKLPHQIYVMAQDWTMQETISKLVESLLTPEERLVWMAMNTYAGSGVRDAEDTFIFRTVDKYWGEIEANVENVPFHVISAKKVISLLRWEPERTPGVGVQAWGTGASAEVNVHLDLSEDTVRWEQVREKLDRDGVTDVLAGLNRQVKTHVPDPIF